MHSDTVADVLRMRACCADHGHGGQKAQYVVMFFPRCSWKFLSQVEDAFELVSAKGRARNAHPWQSCSSLLCRWWLDWLAIINLIIAP